MEVRARSHMQDSGLCTLGGCPVTEVAPLLSGVALVAKLAPQCNEMLLMALIVVRCGMFHKDYEMAHRCRAAPLQAKKVFEVQVRVLGVWGSQTMKLKA